MEKKIHLKGIGYIPLPGFPIKESVWCGIGGIDGINKLGLIYTEDKKQVTCQRCKNYLHLN